MAEPISAIRNLGPAMESAFNGVGIMTAEELRDIGPDAAYQKLLENGTRPHFIGYYVLVMGLQGRSWNDCKGKEKDALRKRFDAIKVRAKPDPSHEIEKHLNAIGVIPKPQR